MCLLVINETFTGKDKTIGVGYKRFRVTWEGILKTPVYFTGKIIPRGKWKADTAKGNIRGLESYPKGFHFFASKVGADDYAVGTTTQKIFYRRLVAVGKQKKYSRFKALVAKEIFIPDRDHPEPPEYAAQKKRAAKKRAAAKSRKSTNRKPARAPRNKRCV